MLSFIIQRGKCRRCGAAIDATHPQVELVAALIGGASMALLPSVEGAALALFGWLLLPLAWLDARHYWLPDPLVLCLALAGLLLGGYISGTGLLDRLVGAFVGGLALAGIASLYKVLRGREGMGGGDPKMLAAMGCWLGWQFLPSLVLIASLLGLFWAILSRFHAPPNSGPDNAGDAPARLPFGTLLALAAPITLWVWPMVIGAT